MTNQPGKPEKLTRPSSISAPQKTVDRDVHASQSPATIASALTTPPVETKDLAQAIESKSANEAIADYRKANDASAREKVTVTLDPAVLGALRDLKKFHKLPQGVAIDLAVKNFYPDLYEKNVQELQDRRNF